MENSELKEKIRKNIKEEIAISNIRKEFDMKTNKNKKIICAISSLCAVVILSIGILIGTGQKLDIKLNINKIKDIGMSDLDVSIKNIEIESLPEKFKFVEDIDIPKDYQLEESYNLYIKKDINIAEYNLLHDYVFDYKKDSINNIKIAFSEVGEPLRDYFIDVKYEISKIGETELIISQWKEMYIVTFKYKDIYFDIEADGITEDELVQLLKSIIK